MRRLRKTRNGNQKPMQTMSQQEEEIQGMEKKEPDVLHRVWKGIPKEIKRKSFISPTCPKENCPRHGMDLVDIGSFFYCVACNFIKNKEKGKHGRYYKRI